jgi:hypothetical protein
MADQLSHQTFDRDGDELAGEGLYVELDAWGPHLLSVVPR